MESALPLPLQVNLTDPSDRFQLRFAQSASALLRDVQLCQLVASASGLQINAVSEPHLEELVQTIRDQFPRVVVSPLRVVYLESPQLQEPFVRVLVNTPEEFSGDVIGDLHRRRALIVELTDSEIGKRVGAEAPSAELLGYASALAVLTQHRGTSNFEFLGYRPARPPSGPPRNPAMQA